MENLGYYILRFVADNPGFWIFHCHDVFHAEVSWYYTVNMFVPDFQYNKNLKIRGCPVQKYTKTWISAKNCEPKALFDRDILIKY